MAPFPLPSWRWKEQIVQLVHPVRPIDGGHSHGARACATPVGEKAIEVAETPDHPYSLVMACWGLGWLYNVRGAFDQASALLERGLANSRKWELSAWLPNDL
jgi:hypothetical protein